jgi:hypothetical protein
MAMPAKAAPPTLRNVRRQQSGDCCDALEPRRPDALTLFSETDLPVAMVFSLFRITNL